MPAAFQMVDVQIGYNTDLMLAGNQFIQNKSLCIIPNYVDYILSRIKKEHAKCVCEKH